VKPCRTCQFFRGAYGSGSCYRSAYRVERVNYVSGSTEIDTYGIRVASTERESIRPWRCGPKGRHHKDAFPK